MKKNTFTNFFDTDTALFIFLHRITEVSKTLYHLDLMSTGCVENEIFGEYNAEADEIVKMVHAGFPLTFAVKTVFDAMFWDDCLSEESLNKVCLSPTNSF
jgi:hypothetical protein